MHFYSLCRHLLLHSLLVLTLFMDSCILAQDIFKADDNISFSPPLSMSFTKEQKTCVSMERTDKTLSQRRSNFEVASCPHLSESYHSKGGESLKNDAMECISNDSEGCTQNIAEQYYKKQHKDRIEIESSRTHLAKSEQTSQKCSNKTASGDTTSFQSASPAMQRLKSFKFVKIDRKRTSEGRESAKAAVSEGPPLKKPVGLDGDHITERRIVKPSDVDREVGTLAREEHHSCNEQASEGAMSRWSSTSSSMLQNLTLLTNVATSNQPNMLTTAVGTLITAADKLTTAGGHQTDSATPRPHTPLHVNRKSVDSGPIQTRSTSEFFTPSQSRFSISTPLRTIGLTTPSSRLATPSSRLTTSMTTPISSSPATSSPTHSKNFTPQRSISTGASRLSSRLLTPLQSSSNAPSRISTTPSVYSTPQSRRMPSSAITALICTPTNEPGSTGVGIMRTPVPLPRRKFPGPAGLLPPLVHNYSDHLTYNSWATCLHSIHVYLYFRDAIFIVSTYSFWLIIKEANQHLHQLQTSPPSSIQ